MRWLKCAKFDWCASHKLIFLITTIGWHLASFRFLVVVVVVILIVALVVAVINKYIYIFWIVRWNVNQNDCQKSFISETELNFDYYYECWMKCHHSSSLLWTKKTRQQIKNSSESSWNINQKPNSIKYAEYEFHLISLI